MSEIATETVETDITEAVEAAQAVEDNLDDDNVDATTQEKLTKLRSEAYELRKRTKAAEARADELARALWTARVAATGKVSNPAEITYDAARLDDADAINAAVDAAIAERPYIKARKISGDAGQGQHGQTAPLDFSGLFK